MSPQLRSLRSCATWLIGEENFKETWSDIEIGNLIKLSEIKDFDGLGMYNY
jgi:hypothetical protein